MAALTDSVGITKATRRWREDRRAPPLRGGFPVDYGPRLDDRRYPPTQAPSRAPVSKGQQQMSDDQDEAPPSRHLWVGNVSQEVTEGQLVEKFSKFGPIESVTVYSQRNYAFINFKNLEHAQDAKNALQGVVLGGLAMRIEFAKGAKPSRHLWVGGIGLTVTREVIEGEFRRFGMLEDFKFLRDRNCAFVDYVRIEDAIAAVDSLNRKRLGDEELRVDFGRSQPPKRETRPGSALGDEWGNPSRDLRGHPDQFTRVPSDSYRGPPDVFRDSDRGPPASVDIFRGPAEGFQAGMGGAASGPGPGRGREKEEPSDVLWVGFPLLSKVDEEGLRRAFMPYGEVERVKTFPGRTYAFVQFKNVEEATRAKNSLEGKLFNDPRVHIRFSNSEIGPVDNPRTDSLVSPSGGREPGTFPDKSMVSRIPPPDNRFPASNPPLRPTGLRPEYYPGGLASGAALARAAAVAGPGLAAGRGAGRGLAPDARMPVDERSYLAGGQGGRSLPNPRPGSRAPFEDSWELQDDEILSRESKRMRVHNGGGPEAASYDGGRRFGDADAGFGPMTDTGSRYGGSQSRSTGLGDDYIQGSGAPRPRIGPLQFDPPRPSAPAQAQLHAGGPPGPAKRETLAPEVGGVVGINEGWRWHGTIAKGGTPVCRARCLPIGKGIDVTVPDVVNCTARTDLDMLAKHVYQAGDFGVVFFVPETDPDVPPYRDFMHYLGEKHRAGVAKLADGTTLFLVPPSEFSERVLKVPGNNCLFGVVLKAPQPLPAPFTQPQAVPPQQLHPPPQSQSSQQQQPPPPASHSQPYSQSQGPSLSNGLPSQEKGSFQGPPPPQGRPPASVATASNVTQSQLSNLPGGLPTGLTPELIASLTALLPQQQGSGPAPPTSTPPPMSASNPHPPANGGFLNRGDPSYGSAAPSMPPPSGSIDNRANFRPAQGSQPSQGWPSNHSEQQQTAAGGNHLTSSAEQQTPAFAPPSQQQPPVPLPVPPNQPQPHPGAPTSQGQLGFPGSQSQSFPAPAFGGQQPLPQQPRPPQHPPPQLGGTPQLPADQLAQLTALLTQRQQQPAQQQQAAQLLQQHYQQQQPPPAGHPAHPPQPPLPPHQPHNTSNYNQQQNQPPQYNSQQGPPQPQWGQGPPQHNSQNAGHGPASSVNGGGWDHGAVNQGQQHQQQQQTAVPPPQPPSQLQQQQQQHGSSGGGGSDQGGASSQDEAERQKRFQATLQLAAALLQQMQHQQAPGQSNNGDQR